MEWWDVLLNGLERAIDFEQPLAKYKGFCISRAG